MSVKIHGKEYRTVAERVNLFHEEHKDAVIRGAYKFFESPFKRSSK